MTEKPSGNGADRNEDETRLIVESMPGLGWSTDPVGNFKYVNPSVLEYLGAPKEALDRAAGTNTFGWESVVHPDDAENTVKDWLHSLKTGAPFQSLLRIRRFDGTYRWFRNAGQPSRDHTGRVTGWYGTTIDIDEQKKAEEALRRSDNQFRTAIGTIPTLVWAARPDGSAEFFNRRWLDYTGLTEDDARDWGWVAAIHPDDSISLGDTWRTIIASGEPAEAEARLRRSDGEYRWFLFRAAPLRDEAGEIVKWYGTNTDIEERRQAEQRTQEAERQLRAVIDTVPMIVWSALPDGTNDFHNQRLLSYTGFSPEQAQDMGWKEMIHPDDVHRHGETWIRSVKTGNSFECESRLRRGDGVYRWFLARAEPMRDEAGQIVKWYGTNVDIDDRKRAEQENAKLRQLEADLARVNRVSMMGELAASLAHEIKQPIAAATMNTSTCLRWLENEPPRIEDARRKVSAIANDMKRATDIIDRNHSLYRRESSQREPIDLNEVIRHMIALLRDTADRNSILIRTELDPKVAMTAADRVQVQQVLMNLMLNGIEAMKESSGTLTIASKQSDDNQLMVSVSDSGVGLPVEGAERVFETLFTTKPDGTGIGLPLSRRIIESHGGRIWASANTPRGAVFHFTVPVTQDVTS
jgi:PAS domain S-box-containing protein